MRSRFEHFRLPGGGTLQEQGSGGCSGPTELDGHRSHLEEDLYEEGGGNC